MNPKATYEAIANCIRKASAEQVEIPKELISRYGADAMAVLEMDAASSAPSGAAGNPDGFPYLAAQLRYAVRCEMVIHLDDFFLRRLPLYLSRSDHGLPWAEQLAQIWAEETGQDSARARIELERLKAEIQQRSAWKARL